MLLTRLLLQNLQAGARSAVRSAARSRLLPLLLIPALTLAAQVAHSAGPEKLSFQPAVVPQMERSSKPTVLGSSGLSGRAALQMELAPAPLLFAETGRPALHQLPDFSSVVGGRVSGRSSSGEVVVYTIDPELQALAEKLVRNAKSHHVAIALMEPHSGKLLALAEKSRSVKNALLHDGVPAASLFKVVTAAAAIERSDMNPYSKVFYRGGTYTLERWNYLPDRRRDNLSMTLAEALGRSCNPVFGRVALNNLSAPVLKDYAMSFGFNRSFDSDIVVPQSPATIPSAGYELSRTAAGFGRVYISPIHAAMLMATVANEGLVPRPQLVEEIYNEKGLLTYRAQPLLLGRAVQPKTASALMDMLRYTTTVGTSRSEFARSKNNPGFPVPVAAKTGTLRGTNPKGLNQWFIGAAPLSNPQVAVAILVVDPGNTASKASRMGRQMIDLALKVRN